MSLSRNSASNVIAGKPPPAGSLMPGVMNKKLMVAMNSKTDTGKLSGQHRVDRRSRHEHLDRAG